MPFTVAELQYLSSQRLGRLATMAPDGTLQNNPVGFRHNAELDTVDIGGRAMGATRKFRNVKANGQVAFVVDDIESIDPWTVRCLEIRGDAEALLGDDDADPVASAIIRIHPRRIISWGM